MKNIFDHIVAKKIPCYFISPHLDDAVFSAGDLMAYLANYTTVEVVNVFTEVGEEPFTLSAKVYVKSCGFDNAKNLYTARRKEDAKVFKKLLVRRTNLGFVDALFRKKKQKNIPHFLGMFIPELLHTYPTYRLHISKGKISQYDRGLMKELKKALSVIPSNAYVFCPLGIGSHVDHVITRVACEKIFKKLILWSDYPYNIHGPETAHAKARKYKKVHFSKKFSEKLKLMKQYKTQYHAVFSSIKPEKADEVFYIQ